MPNRPTLSVLLCLIGGLISLAVAQGSDVTCSAPSGVKSSCVCQTDAGQVIDLRPLSESNGKAKYVTVYLIFIVQYQSQLVVGCMSQRVYVT